MKIYFKFLAPATLPNRSALKTFIAKSIRKAGFTLDSLTIVMCNDRYLLNINKLYLSHHYFTDIITFNLSDSPVIINGELYISIDRVRSNASDFNVSIKEELHRVIFHGVLHLLGYNDKTISQKKKIRELEDRWLLAYGFNL